SSSTPPTTPEPHSFEQAGQDQEDAKPPKDETAYDIIRDEDERREVRSSRGAGQIAPVGKDW
ncbi:MAG: hypothetical protein GX589_01735, partial [Deltaproteobacteria bacterium]|nr:hypothetical protein [Deltaproteobacteria bacterium]